MIPLTSGSVVFLVFFLGATSCSADILVGDLPEDVIDELIQVLTGTLKLTEQCGPPQEHEIDFLLYTRSNPNNSITITSNNLTGVDPSKKVVVLIHGWVASPQLFGFPELRDAYLERYDCNLIMVDWSQVAAYLYTTAYCELPAVGQLVADFLCHLSDQLSIPLSSIHIVGHSLGAEMAGFIGTFTRATCGQQVGRISGLDAAGLLFQGVSEDRRLDPSDAIFVDVVLTNELVAGYYGNIGNVTFHVNCGTLQNGCPEIAIIDKSTILTTALSVVGCHHLRSVYYWIESLTSLNFKARSCTTCPYLCIGDISDVSYISMGEDCPVNPPKKIYTLPINSSPPYAQGCAPYGAGSGCT